MFLEGHPRRASSVKLLSRAFDLDLVSPHVPQSVGAVSSGVRSESIISGAVNLLTPSTAAASSVVA